MKVEAVETTVPWKLRGRRRSMTGTGTPWGRAAAAVRETGRVSMMRVAPFPFSGEER